MYGSIYSLRILAEADNILTNAVKDCTPFGSSQCVLIQKSVSNRDGCRVCKCLCNGCIAFRESINFATIEINESNHAILHDEGNPHPAAYIFCAIPFFKDFAVPRIVDKLRLMDAKNLRPFLCLGYFFPDEIFRIRYSTHGSNFHAFIGSFQKNGRTVIIDKMSYCIQNDPQKRLQL